MHFLTNNTAITRNWTWWLAPTTSMSFEVTWNVQNMQKQYTKSAECAALTNMYSRFKVICDKIVIKNFNKKISKKHSNVATGMTTSQ